MNPLLRAAILALGFTPAAFAAADEPAAAALRPPTTHTLYMGADLSVEWKGRLYPVRGVEGSSFVIYPGKQRVTVSTRFIDDLRIKVDSNVKLSATSARVANFKTERAYTPEADPRKKMERMAGFATSGTASSDVARAGVSFAEFGVSVAKAGGDAAQVQAAENNLQNKQQAYGQSLQEGQSSIYDLGTYVSQMNRELMEQRFDALEVTFELSAPRPLIHPYVVVIARYLETPDEPKTAHLLVYAQAMSSIDATPQKVRVYRGGLPPGYKLDDCQVHLYDDGTEVATSVAHKQVPLTTDEAYQYSFAEYAAKNRRQTLPAVPASAFWPAGLRQRLPESLTLSTCYVKVGQDGRPAGVFEDEACQHQVTDARLETLVADLRFFPALDKGKPVEGVAAVKLGPRD